MERYKIFTNKLEKKFYTREEVEEIRKEFLEELDRVNLENVDIRLREVEYKEKINQLEDELFGKKLEKNSEKSIELDQQINSMLDNNL